MSVLLTQAMCTLHRRDITASTAFSCLEKNTKKHAFFGKKRSLEQQLHSVCRCRTKIFWARLVPLNASLRLKYDI